MTSPQSSQGLVAVCLREGIKHSAVKHLGARRLFPEKRRRKIIVCRGSKGAGNEVPPVGGERLRYGRRRGEQRLIYGHKLLGEGFARQLVTNAASAEVVVFDFTLAIALRVHITQGQLDHCTLYSTSHGFASEDGTGDGAPGIIRIVPSGLMRTAAIAEFSFFAETCEERQKRTKRKKLVCGPAGLLLANEKSRRKRTDLAIGDLAR